MHRYDPMSSWHDKLPFYASTEKDIRDMRNAEDIGLSLTVIRAKQPKRKLHRLHDSFEELTRG